jgi:hypothetical protein
VSPVLYGEDGYYHIAVSNFIKEYGVHYKFHWAQFSTFKDFFSDKEFLFHVLSIPSLALTRDLVLAGKYAVIFYTILFVVSYVYILRKYLPDFLAAYFLLLPFFSLAFTIYFTYLRSVTLMNIITILGIYFLINKKWGKVFVLSLLYTLVHVSFLMLIVFAVMGEIIRLAFNKEFFLRNIWAAALGTLAGCVIHPNFPDNLLSLHLNFFLVPLYAARGMGIDFGDELSTASANSVFIDNFAVFLSFIFIVWVSFWSRTKVSVATLIWWACTLVYLALSFSGNRYWYTANVLFFIFFASYVKDWIQAREWRLVAVRIRAAIITCSFFVVIFLPTTLKNLNNEIMHNVTINTGYQDAAYWMNKNIPPGETVYHAYWFDSPYFICLNPKNDYINVLDPIYMWYRYPKKYRLYVDLANGKIEKPYEVLRQIFKVRFGYCRKDTALSLQVRQDTAHFKILYANKWGIVFEILKPESEGPV